MKRVFFVALFAAAIFISFDATRAYSQGNSDSQSGVDILYPLPEESIMDRLPMISVKLPVSPVIDVATIKFILDGVDVTAEAQINIEMLMYEPATPLKFGVHTVVIPMSDSNGNALPPVKWKFTVVSQQVVKQPAAVKSSKKPESMKGKYVIKFKDVMLNNASRSETWSTKDSPSDIKHEEGKFMTGMYDFTRQRNGKTTIGKYERNITPILGKARSEDEFSFRMVTKQNDLRLGDVSVTHTELTINGANLRGVYNVRKVGKNTLKLYAGRTREPQDGRLKRFTAGMVLEGKASKSNILTFSTLHSKEDRQPTNLFADPNTDTITSVRSFYTYSPSLIVDSEVAMSRHTQEISSANLAHGKDIAIRSIVRYGKEPWSMSVGTRNVGPRYFPTVYSSYTETDRKGTFVELGFKKPSKKFVLSNKYDVYHNNLHNTAKASEITRSGMSSLTLDYGWVLPTVATSFRKQYSVMKWPSALSGYRNRESTTFTINTTKNIHDMGFINSTKIQNTYTRSDSDNYTVENTISNVISRRNQSKWMFSTRFKDIASLNYSSTLSKTNNVNVLTHTRSLAEGLQVQLFLIPSKLVATVSMNRSMTNTRQILTGAKTADQLEYDQKAAFLYVLSPKKRISLEATNYDKQYRALIDVGRSYDEQSLEMSYMVDF